MQIGSQINELAELSLFAVGFLKYKFHLHILRLVLTLNQMCLFYNLIDFLDGTVNISSIFQTFP